MTQPTETVPVERVADAAARRLTYRFRYRGPAEEVWAAFTDPARISRWFEPVAADPEQEDTYTITFEHEGEVHHKTFTVAVCTAPSRLAGTLHDPGFPDSSIEVSVDAAAAAATFTHSGVPEALFEAYAAGWAFYLGRLAASVAPHRRGRGVADPC